MSAKRPTARQLIHVAQGSCPDGGHPPGGRCLKVCYCRKCPHYKPLPKTTIQAPTTRGTASTKRMAESWNTREEPTWLDR